MSDKKDRIKAVIVSKLHRSGYYSPRAAPMEAASSFGVASHDRGLAKEAIAEMADDDDTPVLWKAEGHAVMLDNTESERRIALYIAGKGGYDAVPWDLKDEISER